MFLLVLPFGSLATSFPANQNAPDLIPGSTVGFFSSRELLRGMFGKYVSVFQYPLSIFCLVFSSEKAPALC